MTDTKLTVLGWVFAALWVALLVIAAAYALRDKPQVRAALRLPIRPATPEQEAIADDFEDHVADALALFDPPADAELVPVWCKCCGDTVLLKPEHVVAHILTHYEPFPVRRDFELWERQLSGQEQ